MTINSNVSRLMTYSALASKASKAKPDNIIKLFEDRHIANFKTALNTVLYPANLVTVVSGKSREGIHQ